MKEIGTIGDDHPLENGGGIVFETDDGTIWIEYAEAPCEDDPWFARNGYKSYDLPLRNARYTVYCVEVREDVKADLSWVKDWARIASHGNGETPKVEGEALAYSLSSRAPPMTRAFIYWDVALYYGWENLDSYPLRLSGAELAVRWGLDPSWGDKTCEVRLWEDTALAMREMCRLISVLEHGDTGTCEAALSRIRDWLKEHHEETSQFQADLDDALTEAGFGSPRETEEDE